MTHTSSENQSLRVSIGMPVYNGENFIREALDSILNQTFQGFEVVISDNASTDQTEAICKAYAARDSRIRYYRNKENLGATRNYNRVFELATGTYFKWAAHDDVIAPDFLEKCVAVLDEDPSIVVSYASTVAIDQAGSVLRVEENPMRTDSITVSERFFDLVYYHQCFPFCGLIRTDVLRTTPLIQSHAGSDGCLLVELALHGRIVEVEGCLLFLRSHPQQSTRKHPDARERVVWFDPAMSNKLSFPAWRILWSYAASLRRVPLRLYDRIACSWSLLKWVVLRKRVLAGELKKNLVKKLTHKTKSSNAGDKEPLIA